VKEKEEMMVMVGLRRKKGIVVVGLRRR